MKNYTDDYKKHEILLEEGERIIGFKSRMIGKINDEDED